MATLAIDPATSLNSWCGWSLFDCGGTLDRAGRMRVSDMLEKPPLIPELFRSFHVIIERPVIYPFGKGKGDPNVLLDLTIEVGDLRGYYRRLRGYSVELVEPRTWKGTIDKLIKCRQILKALTDSERAILPKNRSSLGYDHNMLDAVGLGLWHMRRKGLRL